VGAQLDLAIDLSFCAPTRYREVVLTASKFVQKTSEQKAEGLLQDDI